MTAKKGIMKVHSKKVKDTFSLGNAVGYKRGGGGEIIKMKKR